MAEPPVSGPVDEATRGADARFRTMADAAPVLIWETDSDGVVFVNGHYLDFFGATAADVLGMGWARFLHPDDAPGYVDVYVAAAVERRPFTYECRFRRADGQWRWLRNSGGPVGQHRFVGCSFDVTDLQEAQTVLEAQGALRESEARLRASEAALQALNASLEHQVAERTRDLLRSRARASIFFRITDDYLFLVRRGADGLMRVEDMNPASEAVMGLARAEVVGRPVQDVLPADSARDIARHGTACIATRQPQSYLALREYRPGSSSVIEGHVAFVEHSQAEGSLVLFSGRDVTEQRRTEEALRQSQKMEAVGQLTGGLAHDFNNLLAGISGALELMQSRMRQGRLGDIERYIAAAQGAARRAAALTHRLLAFSRRQTLDPRPTDVTLLATGMQEMIQRTVGPGIPVEVKGTTAGWSALVDPSQLENALLNLCINARDAMPDGGSITIETAAEPEPHRHGLPEGQYLAIAVTDTGTGMAPEVIARAFEPFFTTKPIGEGTGLGLSMIYGFAQQSGGQVHIRSGLGQGTTVCIHLPRHHGAAPGEAAAPEVPAPGRSREGETVLIVDDEPTVRMLVTDALQELGYLAIEAGDSAAGLRVLQSDVRIDLLVTDVGLPGGMNGRQMVDAARLHRPDLKVLFITGYAENAILAKGALPPWMAVLTKPFAMEAMAARIRSMIEDGRQDDFRP